MISLFCDPKYKHVAGVSLLSNGHYKWDDRDDSGLSSVYTIKHKIEQRDVYNYLRLLRKPI